MGTKSMRNLWILFSLAVIGICYSNCEGHSPISDSSISPQSSSCAGSPLLGTWYGNVGAGSADVLTFNSDCSLNDTVCAARGFYQNVTAGAGDITVNITSNNGLPICVPVGTASCTYLVNGNTLNYACGAGTLTFNRQAPVANSAYLPHGTYTSANQNWCSNGSCNSASQPAACSGVTTFGDVAGDFTFYSDTSATFWNSITEVVDMDLNSSQVTLTTNTTGHSGYSFTYQFLGGSPAKWEIMYGANCGRLYICHIGSCL